MNEQARRDQWARKRMDALEAEYAECTQCPKLVDTGWWKRSNIVFGEGYANADILFVGIGPGEDEDLCGIPFVGPTGQLLDDFLIHLCPSEELDPYRQRNRPAKKKDLDLDEWREVRGILSKTERLFYTNSVLCRPVVQVYDDHRDTMRLKNRDPANTECAACRERLRRTIYYADPLLIISLGGPALHALLALDQSTARTKRPGVLGMSGSFVDLAIPGEVTDVRYTLLVLPHPAYLLRYWDEDVKTGNVQTTFRHLVRGFELVDQLRHDMWKVPLPERKN